MSESVQSMEGADLLSPIRRWPSRRSQAWVSRFLRSAQADENIRAVIAVGSSVRRGVASVDLDLVVLAKDVSKLKIRPPIDVDLRTYPSDQVDALISGGSDLIGWAVMYGKVLLQKQEFWDRIMREWTGRVPLPSEEVSTKRSSEALRRFNNMLEIGDSEAAYEQALSYLTHLARAQLIKNGIYPASRPELAEQLRAIDCAVLADRLEKLVNHAIQNEAELVALVNSVRSH